jgi:glycosyltransferase involved in cell wall biosynthesis
MINIEAFARKTPVIVRDLGALPEVVKESGGGFVYRTDTELLRCVRDILDRPALRGEMGECGYQAFVEKWSTAAHLKLYFAYLRRTALRKFGEAPWEGKSASSAHVRHSVGAAAS